MGDDVSVGRNAGGLVGRRAVAGTMLGQGVLNVVKTYIIYTKSSSSVCKITGAASEAFWSYQDCLKLARGTADNLVSIAALLDHASVPGRSEFGKIPENTAEIGVGLHNEPVSPTL